MEKVELGDIHNNGFIYRSYNEWTDTIVHHRLNELMFEKSATKDDSCPSFTDLDPYTKDYYLTFFKRWGLCIHNVTFRSRRLLPKHCVELHTCLAKAQYKAIIFCPINDYKGAEFIYGTEDELVYFKPKFGDIMFCKTSDINYVHGFKKLKSDEPLRYLEFFGGLKKNQIIEDACFEGLNVSKIIT